MLTSPFALLFKQFEIGVLMLSDRILVLVLLVVSLAMVTDRSASISAGNKAIH